MNKFRFIASTILLLAGGGLPGPGMAITVVQGALQNNAQGTIQTLRIGAGGQITGIDIQCDQGVGACNNSGTTTKVIRPDTYGAYLWVTSGTCDIGISAPCWQQLVTHNSLPANDPNNVFGVCANGTACAAYEIRIAPSNTNIAYMYLNGYVYVTTNLRDGKSVKWTATTFSHVRVYSNENTKFFGPFLAIDPQNPDVVVVGTPSGSAYYTTNGTSGGSSTFSAITLGTACTPATLSGAHGGGYIFAYDPSSKVSGGQKQGLYLGCYGTGIYHSTTGPSGTFSLLNTSGMPTVFKHMVVPSNGLVYVTDGTNLKLYSSGVWSTLLDGTSLAIASQAVAVDPNSLSHILVFGSASTGGSYYSANSGTSWGKRITLNSRTATDIPWLATTKEGGSSGDIAFDPAQSNTLYFAEGIGVWTINPNSDGNCAPNPNYCYKWTSQSAGIEQLVTNWVVSPPGGNPILAAWDRPIWTVINPNVYPSNHGVNYDQVLMEGWSADYASGYVFELSNCGNGSGKNNNSGYSSNGGGDGKASNWTVFASLPATAQCGGDIAALDTNHVAIVQNAMAANIYFTTDRGATFPLMTACSGVPTSGTTGWGSNVGINVNRHILTADKTGGFYYAFNYNVQPGIYKIAPYGTTCARMTTKHFDPVSVDGYGASLRAVPGQAGHLFFTAGSQAPDVSTQAFWHCVDRGTMACSSSDSFVKGVTDVWAFGFGVAKPGDTFPALYCYCRVGGVPGLWRGTNLSTTAVWNKLSDWWVGGWLDGIRNVEGDKNTYGKVYIGTQGSGWKYGQF